MSATPPQDGGPIELSFTLGALRVTIAGPADQAADLLRYITQRGYQAAAPVSPSEASFELVGSDPVATRVYLAGAGITDFEIKP